MTPLDDRSRLPVHDIMCIDCKSFFASVEAIRRSEYPLAAKNAVLSRAESAGGLVLAGSPLAKANYGVRLGTRKFELRGDMDVQLVPPHMAEYIRINYLINQIYRQFTDDLHWYVYSIDESFIDVTHSHSLFGSNEEIASRIQDKVFQATGIITSVGMGANPLLAKLALDNAAKKRAPWQAMWTYDDVPNTIWQIQSLTDFWSIGSRTAAKLNAMGIDNLYQLAHTPKKILHQHFGVLGEALYYHAWGIDYSLLERRYVPRSDNKGYGNSQVLMRDYTTLTDCLTVLGEIADQVATRLRRAKVQGEVVGIDVGFAEPDLKGATRFGAQVHIDPTNRTDDIVRAVRYLFKKKWAGNALRSVGVRVNRISKPSSFQLSLFEPADRRQANGRLEHAIDQIRDKYGFKTIVRGASKTAGGTAIERAGMVGGHQA